MKLVSASVVSGAIVTNAIPTKFTSIVPWAVAEPAATSFTTIAMAEIFVASKAVMPAESKRAFVILYFVKAPDVTPVTWTVTLSPD